MDCPLQVSFFSDSSMKDASQTLTRTYQVRVGAPCKLINESRHVTRRVQQEEEDQHCVLLGTSLVVLALAVAVAVGFGDVVVVVVVAARHLQCRN